MTDDSVIPLHDTPDDDALRAQLRAGAPSAVLSDVRAEALRARILASAASRLASRAAPAPSFLDLAARWSRVAMQTSAFAAGLGAIVVLAASSGSQGNPAVGMPSVGPDSTAPSALRVSLYSEGTGVQGSEDLVAQANGLSTSNGGFAVASEGR